MKTMMMMTMMTRKRGPHPTRTRRRLFRPTRTHQRGAVRAPADTLSIALLIRSPQVPLRPPAKSPPHVEFGPAEGRPRRVAGEQRSPGEHGRHLLEPFPQAVRAAPPAAASHPAWSIHYLSTASLQGQSCPRPAVTSHPPPKEDLLPSDPFLLFVPFHPAAIGHLKFRHLPHPWGCSTEPLDTCPGRALVHQVVMSDW